VIPESEEVEVLHDGAQFVGGGRGHREERHAHLVGAFAHEGAGLLDRDRVGLGEKRARQRQQLVVKLARPRDISEVKLDPAFHELHREIWHMLKVEVIKGYAQAEGR